MILNAYHQMYITNGPLIKFIRLKRIRYNGLSLNCENLFRVINDAFENGQIQLEELDNNIFTWLYQGRKKLLLRSLDSQVFSRYRNLEVLSQFIDEHFPKIEAIQSLVNLRLCESQMQFIDSRYQLNSENNALVDKAILIFVHNLKHEKKTINGPVQERIPLPVFIDLDLKNNEIVGRVCTKSDLYRLSDEKVEDLEIGKLTVEHVLRVFGVNESISQIDKAELSKVIFTIHEEVTKLPEEIVNKGEQISQDIYDFIDVIDSKLDIIDNDIVRDELCDNIKNVVLKEIINTYADKTIFEDGKYAISIGIDASGKSLSKLKYNAPASEPVQSNPEYQNIKNVLAEAETIKKNVLLWKSVVLENNKIRSKIYIEEDSYGVISFEEYVLEGDIENVLSKIRELKQNPRL